MQYLLTQQELDDLKAAQTQQLRLSTKKLQTLCTKICNEMPVKWGWGGPDPKPWTCILTQEDDEEWYCDQCPVTEICPGPIHWSK